MAEDLHIQNNHAENRVVTDMKPEDNTPGFRVFRISPDSIHVQVRTNSSKQVRIAGCGLSRADARKVAARLIKFADGKD